MAIVLFRLVWGFGSKGHARFRDFVYSPSQTLRYVGSVIKGNARRYLGHNPLGGWMVIMLWLFIISTCITGWMYTLDRWWGIAWVGDLHETLTNILLVLVFFHVAGVLFSSWHQKENLVAAMIHGRKKPLEKTME